jgi:hypothetical protein
MRHAVFLPNERAAECFFGFFTAHPQQEHAAGVLQGGVPVLGLVRKQGTRPGWIAVRSSQDDVVASFAEAHRRTAPATRNPGKRVNPAVEHQSRESCAEPFSDAARSCDRPKRAAPVELLRDCKACRESRCLAALYRVRRWVIRGDDETALALIALC